MYNVGDRVQFRDGSFATVRFVGLIPQWGDEVTALGVEWDDETRGKNNGNIGNQQYFIPQKEGAGSFIKSNNSKLLEPKTFEQALIEQYGWEDGNIIDLMKFGTKVVENYGFDKLNAMNANFSKLISISLDKQGIMSGNDSGIGFSLDNVTKLDLSYNLFTSFEEIQSIIEKLPKLKTLNLNGNQLNKPGANVTLQNPTVTALHMSNTDIPISSLNQLLACFPNLAELSVASNHYEDIDIEKLDMPAKLKYIDLSFNDLTKVPKLACDNVVLANNRIRSVDEFSIRILDVRYNLISDWEVLNDLSLIDVVEELRINGNPVFDGLHEDEVMIHIVGRFICSSKPTANQLYKLNGSYLTEDEITNSELYFINKVKQQEYDCINKKRYELLLQKYQMKSAANVITNQSTAAKYHEFYYDKLRVNIYKTSMEGTKSLITNKLVLKSFTILRLLGLISKLTGESILAFNVYYFINEDLSLKQYLDDEIATINDFQLSDNQDIYVEII